MDSNDQMKPGELEPLTVAFRDQLMACLEECARGRRGLFAGYEHLGETDGRAWPEATRLRELASALQSILAQSEERDALCDDGRIRVLRVVRGHQSGDVDQHRGRRRFSGKWIGRHRRPTG